MSNPMQSERDKLLQQVDKMLDEIVVPVVRALLNGAEGRALAAAGTERMADYILQREQEARYDELLRIPVIETRGVGYEVIVRHRMERLAALTPKSTDDNFRKVQKLVKEGKISDRAACLHAALGTAPKSTEPVRHAANCNTFEGLGENCNCPAKRIPGTTPQDSTATKDQANQGSDHARFHQQ